MKLSDKTTDEVFDILCVISPLASNIFGDKALMGILSEKMPSGQHSVMEVYRFAVDKYASLVPIVMRNHREDLLGILATLEGKTVQEIKAQKIMVTMGQIREAIQDKELMDFLSSCRHGEVTE